METSERVAQIEVQIHNTRRLLWNASQMRARNGSVGRLMAELDRLVDEKYRVLRGAA